MSSEKLYHIQIAKGEISKYVLLPGDPGRVKKIANYLDSPYLIASNREFTTYRGTYKDVDVTVSSTGIGCPSAAIAIEELILAGAKYFIRVGTCGALQDYIKLGDLIISTATVRDDGTSVQYVPLSFPAVADIDITNALIESAKNLNLNFHVGVTHCKDAFYSEGDLSVPLENYNSILWDCYYKANVLGTSMEASALFTIGYIRKVKVGEVTAVIGHLRSHKSIIKKVGIDDAIKCALEALVIIHNRLEKS